MPVYLAVCCAHCSTYCVQQEKKSKKFTCPICHAPQTIKAALAVSDKASDVRGVVAQLNASRAQCAANTADALLRGQDPPSAHLQQQQHKAPNAAGHGSSTQQQQGLDWSSYVDVDTQLETAPEAAQADGPYFTTLPDQPTNRGGAGKRGGTGSPAGSERLRKARRALQECTNNQPLRSGGEPAAAGGHAAWGINPQPGRPQQRHWQQQHHAVRQQQSWQQQQQRLGPQQHSWQQQQQHSSHAGAQTGQSSSRGSLTRPWIDPGAAQHTGSKLGSSTVQAGYGCGTASHMGDNQQPYQQQQHQAGTVQLQQQQQQQQQQQWHQPPGRGPLPVTAAATCAGKWLGSGKPTPPPPAAAAAPRAAGAWQAFIEDGVVAGDDSGDEGPCAGWVTCLD